MKFILTILAAAILLIGCAAPNLSTSTMKSETHKIFVVNSLWEVIKIIEVSDSREIISNDIKSEVEAYNIETLDDFLRIYYDTLPDIDNAPLVSVFICNPETYEVNMAQYNIPRRSLVENQAGWHADARGQILFIDHVPPPPVVIPPVSMYAWYALYVVNAEGGIEFEDHCGWTIDNVWDGQWILDGGWRDADHYRETTRNAFMSEAQHHEGWRFIERQLYTSPVIP